MLKQANLFGVITVLGIGTCLILSEVGTGNTLIGEDVPQSVAKTLMGGEETSKDIPEGCFTYVPIQCDGNPPCKQTIGVALLDGGTKRPTNRPTCSTDGSFTCGYVYTGTGTCTDPNGG